MGCSFVRIENGKQCKNKTVGPDGLCPVHAEGTEVIAAKMLVKELAAYDERFLSLESKVRSARDEISRLDRRRDEILHRIRELNDTFDSNVLDSWIKTVDARRISLLDRAEAALASDPPAVDLSRELRALAHDLSGTSGAPSAMLAGSACPKCSRRLVRRVARTGRHKGKSFLGCSGWPDCGFVADCKAPKDATNGASVIEGTEGEMKARMGQSVWK